MKNRILCLLLAMIMVVSLLCSCGGNKDDDPKDTDPTQKPSGDAGGDASYPWTSEQLIFQMNMNDNGGQLSSMCKRYLAGGEGGTEVDNKVIIRNGPV